MVRRWSVPAGLAVLLAAAGWFFATRDLSDADQYASVAGFLLALVVAGVTLIVHLRGRDAERHRPADTAPERSGSPPEREGAGTPTIAPPGEHKPAGDRPPTVVPEDQPPTVVQGAQPPTVVQGNRTAIDADFVSQGDGAHIEVTFGERRRRRRR